MKTLHECECEFRCQHGGCLGVMSAWDIAERHFGGYVLELRCDDCQRSEKEWFSLNRIRTCRVRFTAAVPFEPCVMCGVSHVLSPDV